MRLTKKSNSNVIKSMTLRSYLNVWNILRREKLMEKKKNHFVNNRSTKFKFT